MKFAKRFIYLLYYLKGVDFKQLNKFLQYATIQTGNGRPRIFYDAIFSVFKYNISLNDYFYFRFFELSRSERSSWAGTGFMYEYQLKMNPKGARQILEDKILFLDQYRSFVSRDYYSLNELKSNVNFAAKLLANRSGRLVIKDSHGQVGAEVEVVSCDKYTPETLINYMNNNGFDLAEEYVVQHHLLMNLSPSGLNTIRIFTQLHEGKVCFLGARLRVSVNSAVDNMGAGNLAAPVDMESGKIQGPGVYSDITKEDEEFHPISGNAITGFFVPFWNEALDLARQAAIFKPENRSVGWDIAITEEGPELIEGNHNWCKLLWQLPVKKGLKLMLKVYD